MTNKQKAYFIRRLQYFLKAHGLKDVSIAFKMDMMTLLREANQLGVREGIVEGEKLTTLLAGNSNAG